MKDERFCNSYCPFIRAIGKIGGKWKPIIINVMANRTIRFGQLAAVIPFITRKVLTEQLRDLEEDGIIFRTVFKEIPPRVEYKLSEKGLALLPILGAIKEWNEEFEERLIADSN